MPARELGGAPNPPPSNGLNLLDAAGAPDILTRRGIADAADAMRWRAGKDGWCYPVYDTTGAPIARRWKNYDSHAAKKYNWRDGTNAQYYHIGAELQQAIADANGLLYIANGEPAVLTFHAAGLINVLSFFGESRAPESLVDDLRALGVETVRYYPDKDQPGHRAAIKLREALDGSGITFDCRALPNDLPAKADTNDLWQRLQFNRQAFTAALDDAPAYDLPAPAPIIRQREFSREITGLDHRDEFISTVVLPAIERAAAVRQGKHFRCINPDHADEHPSARIGKGRGGLLYYCTCGTYSLMTVGKWLGLNYRQWLRDTYPNEAKKRPLRGVHQGQDRPIDHAQPTADLTFNTQWTSEADHLLPRRGVVCVIGDKGTGKSYWGRMVKDSLGGALVITPLINLTRTAAAQYGLELYEGLTTTQRLQTVHRLAITLNSIEHFASVNGQALPRPRLLILDELSKMLAALRSKKLFKRGAATRVFSILGELIRTAELVLVLDADLDAEEIEWLRGIRSDVTVTVNTHVRPYGSMDVLPGDQRGLDAIRTAIGEALAADQGPVFVTSNSKAEIEALGATHQGHYHLLTIHSNNSTNIEQRGFIEQPQITHYQGVFVSPSYATGGDIQDRVYRTFGIFRSDAHDAPLCLQMLARARNPEKTVVWIEEKAQKKPVQWQTIYNNARQKAEGTDKLCDVNADGFLDFDGVQKDLLTLQAKLLARRHRSTNALRADFLARAARNYTITLLEGELRTEGAAAVVQARQELREHREALILTSPPITPEEHQRRSGQGIRSEADNAGLERYLIEHFYKQDITPELLDFDARGKGRERVRLFMDVFHTSEARLKELDKLEAQDRTPFINRSHYTQRQRTIRRVLLAVWGTRANCTPETELGIADINERMTAFLERHAGAFYLYCGGRADHSQDPLKVLQRALRLMGLNLEEIRTRDKDAPKRFRLGRQAWALMGRLAQDRIVGLEKEAAEHESATWGALQKNVEKVFTRAPVPILPPAAVPTSRGGPSRYNPFSTPAIGARL